MKNFILSFLICFAVLGFSQKTAADLKKIKSSSISFTENKGQVCDQNYKPRPDVLFSGTDGQLVFHLKNDGISYQLNRVDSWKDEENPKTNQKIKLPNQSTIYRLDVNWLNTNKNSVVTKGESTEGYNNYYLESCPGGALSVKSYEEVIYKNIYDGIDLKWYQKDGRLKYDYLVAAGIDYKQIQLEIKGAVKISLNNKGDLILKTLLGNIIEQAPLVIQNNKPLKSKWIIKNNIITFDIEGIDPDKDFIIDPSVVVRLWGTYYGGVQDEFNPWCQADVFGNIYLSGTTSTPTSFALATSGSHQSSYGGNVDAVLVKFDSLGVRQWATYYGGSAPDGASTCSVDGIGNIYIGGVTATTVGAVIATPGSHQPNISAINNNNNEGFIVKFNAAGVRQWATYYGGNGDELIYSSTVDANGNVYFCGSTAATTSSAITTNGGHQLTYGGGSTDAFIVKFSPNGIRQWGTYYGGPSQDIGYSCTADLNGNVCMAGATVFNSGTIIATPGSHQPISGGLTDAFLVKFNNAGIRQWGTYYGGVGNERAFSCAADALNNIYLLGLADSTSAGVIATPGAYQTTCGGGISDVILIKFDQFGNRQWGTYYGGPDVDRVTSCDVDINGNIYFAGYTESTIGIATANSYQSIYGGTIDAFLAKFNSFGALQWGTYYGGINTGIDWGFSVDVGINGNIYLAGRTNTSGGTEIASPGSHQPTFAGGPNDFFLVRFFDCTPPSPTNVTPLINQNICVNNSATLSSVSSGTINWFSNQTSTTVLGTGTVFVTPVLSLGTYSYYAEAVDCSPSSIRTEITVTVNPLPIVSINDGLICAGESFTLIPSGANTYTFSSVSSMVSPTTTTSYSVMGTSSVGCISASPAISTVTVNPSPTITASSNSSLICTGQTITLSANGANTYSWNPGGNGTSISISPTVTTNYTVTGTDANGCQDTAVITQNVSLCTGIISSTLNKRDKILIYPNPNDGNFAIELNAPSQIIIYNAIGQIIHNEKQINIRSEISLQKFSNGIYLIQVVDNENIIYSERIIKN